MSSCGNPAVEADAVMPKRRKFDKTKNCIKCKVVQGNIVIRHAVYCKECFFPFMTFKFRRSLEPFVNAKPQGPRRTALKPAGHLLVGFSGGLGSTVVLDLIHRCYIAMDGPSIPTEGGRDHPRHERVWKKITVCYIELCDASPGMKNQTAKIAEVVGRYEGVNFVALRIQDAFDPEWWKKAGGVLDASLLNVSMTEDLHIIASNSSTTPLEKLQEYLAALPTATAVLSTIRDFTRLLLLHTAVETGSSHLVLGSSLTNLAVSLISGISQGMGFNLKEELLEEWVPDPDGTKSTTNTRTTLGVRLIRPLRDIGMKECAAWAWWMELNIVGKAKWHWPGSKQGIGMLTKEFIVGLEKDYPSTVSTIVRTCAKVAPKGDVTGKCALCERPVPSGIQAWKSRISIRSLSQRRAENVDAQPPGNLSLPDTSSAPATSFTPYLCYGCHTTLTSKSSRAAPRLYPHITQSPPATALPTWTQSRLSSEDAFAGKAKMDEQQMRHSIREFLLDD